MIKNYNKYKFLLLSTLLFSVLINFSNVSFTYAETTAIGESIQDNQAANENRVKFETRIKIDHPNDPFQPIPPSENSNTENQSLNITDKDKNKKAEKEQNDKNTQGKIKVEVKMMPESSAQNENSNSATNNADSSKPKYTKPEITSLGEGVFERNKNPEKQEESLIELGGNEEVKLLDDEIKISAPLIIMIVMICALFITIYKRKVYSDENEFDFEAWKENNANGSYLKEKFNDILCEIQQELLDCNKNEDFNQDYVDFSKINHVLKITKDSLYPNSCLANKILSCIEEKDTSFESHIKYLVKTEKYGIGGAYIDYYLSMNSDKLEKTLSLGSRLSKNNAIVSNEGRATINQQPFGCYYPWDKRKGYAPESNETKAKVRTFYVIGQIQGAMKKGLWNKEYIKLETQHSIFDNESTKIVLVLRKKNENTRQIIDKFDIEIKKAQRLLQGKDFTRNYEEFYFLYMINLIGNFN